MDLDKVMTIHHQVAVVRQLVHYSPTMLACTRNCYVVKFLLLGSPPVIGERSACHIATNE